MNDETKARLLSLANEMAAVAAKIGSMHSWWDDIFDMRALANGGTSIIDWTPEQHIAHAEKSLAGHRARLIAP